MNVYDYEGGVVTHICVGKPENFQVCRPHLAVLEQLLGNVPMQNWTMVLFFLVGSKKFIWNIRMHNMEYWTGSIRRGTFVRKVD